MILPGETEAGAAGTGSCAVEKVTALFEEVVTAFPHAVRAVECIFADHLWGRTGQDL